MREILTNEEAAKLLEALEKKDEKTIAALGVESLDEITKIDLRLFGITALPTEIGQLTNLQWLDLSDTPISALPAEIGRLSKLQRLCLAETPISALPTEIGQLTNLQWLDLSDTPISALPAEIGQLTSLQNLDLMGTQISSLPAEIGQLTSLQNLYLSNTQISSFSAEIGQLTNLQTLNLNGTRISALPPEIGQLTNLQELNLSNTQISALPPEIGQLTSLQRLYLYDTQISALPPAIEQLTSLRVLNLNRTRISALPPEIGQLKSLRSLLFDNTDVAELPQFLRHLSDLEILSFDDTKIRTIPGWIKELKSLRILWIRGLTLKELPREVFELDLPFCFSVYNQADEDGIKMDWTVLKTQPVSLFALDRGFIQAYYDEPKVPVREGKVIFLGDGNAGKSHTIERILKNGSDTDINTDQTPGINIKTWTPDCGDRQVQINFWDFGGQEIMHAMHRCFLTGRSLYVVVLRQRSQSRQNDLTIQARYWLENIGSFAPDCPVILAVNREQHSAGSPGINSQQLHDQFGNIVGEPIVYCARGDRDDNFDALTKAILDQALLLDSTEMAFPRSWISVRSELDNMSNRRGRKGSKYYIDKGAYQALCTRYGIRDENIRRWLLEWFNDLGVCFSYHQKDGKELERYQVLNPEWLTNAIYAIIIIGRRSKYSENGVITRSEIDRILRKEILEDPARHEKERTAKNPIAYEFDEQGYVLDIMQKFSLCAQVSDRNYFIPALCPAETPKDFRPGKAEYTDHIRFEFRYSFLPDSVIHRLMIECIKAGFNRKASYFDGIRVDFVTDEVIMSAEADTAKNILAIDIYHKNDPDASRNKLSWVRRKVAEINGSMNLKPEGEILVVCREQKCADLDLDYLYQLHEQGYKTLPLPTQDKKIISCNLDDALRLLYSDRTIRRAEYIMKRPSQNGMKSFKDALAVAEAEPERRKQNMKTGKSVSFSLGISFAGEQRDFVRQVCSCLCAYGLFDREELFFDEWQEHLINGANAEMKLDKIYSELCEKVVVLFSEAYLEKHWTNKLEWTRAITLRITADPDNVCLLRYGDVDIDSIGLLHSPKDIVKNVSGLTPEETAEFIINWSQRPEISPYSGGSIHPT